MPEVPDRFTQKERRFRKKFAVVTLSIAGLSAMHAAIFLEPSEVFFCTRAWCSFAAFLVTELGIFWMYYVIFTVVTILIHVYLSDLWGQRLETQPELGPDLNYAALSERDKEANRIVLLVLLALLSISLSHRNVGGIVYPVRVAMILSDFRFEQPFVLTFRYVAPAILVVVSVVMSRKNAKRFLSLKLDLDDTPALSVTLRDSLIPLVDMKESHVFFLHRRFTLKPCLATEIKLEKLIERFVESDFAHVQSGDNPWRDEFQVAEGYNKLARLDAGTEYVRLVYDRHFDHVVFPQAHSEIDSLVELLNDMRVDCGLSRVTVDH